MGCEVVQMIEWGWWGVSFPSCSGERFVFSTLFCFFPCLWVCRLCAMCPGSGEGTLKRDTCIKAQHCICVVSMCDNTIVIFVLVFIHLRANLQ